MIRGKVILVRFPFDDFSASKVRPVVCLINPIGSYRHVVPAFISSTIPNDLLETDLMLDPSYDDFAGTGLKVPSTLRLYRLMTVTASIFQRELGELSSRIIGEVNNKLKKLFYIT